MKRLSLIMVCLFAMMAASLSAKAQEVTITLKPGWTWIGYPSTDTVDFATALGTFTPREGDMIACEYDFSEYFDGGWFGDIQHFYPGYGYMYYSTRAMPVMVTFNTQPPTPQLTVTTAEPTEITANSAVSGGSITSNNGSYVFVLEKGICWATHPNPMVMNDSFTQNGNGPDSFTAEMTDLIPNTVYYVRAFAVTANGTFYGDELNFTTTPPEGAINGLFTINSLGNQVYFSRGNLQYQASTNIWRFAENQWDYVGTQNPHSGNAGGTVDGSDNCSISSTYNGWIDIFGWGTSGYDHGANCYQPWSTSQTYSDYYVYGNYTYNLYDQTGQADWGYDAISNGGYQENQWRTLTQSEWNYVFNVRITATSIRYAKANVNNVNGVILLPDNWNNSTYSLSNTNSSNASFSSNILTDSQWTILESAGAVFLPAAGHRYGISVYFVGSHGNYWSASYCSRDGAYILEFDNSIRTDYSAYRGCAFSVRLVRNVE